MNEMETLIKEIDQTINRARQAKYKLELRILANEARIESIVRHKEYNWVTRKAVVATITATNNVMKSQVTRLNEVISKLKVRSNVANEIALFAPKEE